nr:cation transporter [Haliscomenobacter sp.]
MSIPQALSDRSLLRLQITALILGVGLMAVKFLAWYRTGSNAILSDALESIINIVAGAFGLYSLLISFKPKDQNHPYGHGKVEFLSAGFEGALISIAGVLILGKAVYNLFYPQELEELKLGIYLTAFTGAANYLMGWVLEWKGMRNNSLILKSSGKHLQADAWSSLGILLGLALVFSTGINQLDNLLALFFGLLIIYSGFGLVRQSIAGIMDEADYRLIRSIVNHLQQNRSENWVDIHNLRVIKYGPNPHIDCHLTLP